MDGLYYRKTITTANALRETLLRFPNEASCFLYGPEGIAPLTRIDEAVRERDGESVCVLTFSSGGIENPFDAALRNDDERDFPAILTIREALERLNDAYDGTLVETDGGLIEDVDLRVVGTSRNTGRAVVFFPLDESLIFG